jgi:exopolysaccharide biosynthesis polyprenyl glycosylphosphotransferase
MRDPTIGYDVRGFVDDELPPGTVLYEDRSVLGGMADLLSTVQSVGATGVVVATTAVDQVLSNRLARELTEAGVHVELSSSLWDISANRLTVRPLGRTPVVYVEPVMRHGWRAVSKRAFDAAVAGVGLLLLSPFLLLVAAAIKLDSRGPVFFRQSRVGRDGRTFSIIKFRTMVANAEELLIDLRTHNEADGPLFKIKDDPRVTRVGRLLRRFSIDESPQFVNVLRGEMSLIGPRPALPDELKSWSPELHTRLRVRPGLTGMWQVSGRSDTTFEEYVRLDLYYVDNWSLVTDVAILARTIPSVLLRRGAC